VHPTFPRARFDIAAFGELVADPSRVAMLLSLMDGLARPASELARIARVAPSTASAHLGRLAEGGLVCAEPRGRHRYFRLAGDRVADTLETIALQATATGHRPVTSDPARIALSHARTCYRHLAGRLGVAWLAALDGQRLLRVHDGAITLAPRGVRRFGDLGLALSANVAGKACLDWTERRPHLGGALGALLTQHLLAMRWIARRDDTRALRITSRGRTGFARLGVAFHALDAACQTD
jgi:DNA-binding transcriptional ArsR family regulator